MGKYFSDAVERAIADIYYCSDREKAHQAADAVFQSAKADGDPDAYYILSRCFFGPGQSWDFHPFTENRAAAAAMLNESVIRGSAAGVLGAVRLDMLTPALEKEMPFSSTEEVWETVKEKADGGSPFCQYMIGNACYTHDIIKINHVSEKDFPDHAAWADWKTEQIRQGLSYLERAFQGGMSLAGRPLVEYYLTGCGGTVPPDEEAALKWERTGADLGYPEWQYRYGVHLYRTGRQDEGCRYARTAISGGHLYAWEVIGDACWEGRLVPQDFQKAVGCYEKAGNSAYAQTQIARAYLFGAQGVPRDYPRAAQLLNEVYLKTSGASGGAMLGICRLLGLGCEPDPQQGKELLESAAPSVFRSYGLGMMYAEGIGVKQNISAGVKHLREAGDFTPAKEALSHYKRGLFGIWKRIRETRE